MLESAPLNHLAAEEFWYVMDHRDWVHPYAFGKRYNYSDLPKSIDKLEDDPFRSLAGELGRAGGFSKDTSPFSEFLWAIHLRHRMDRKNIERDVEWALDWSCTGSRQRPPAASKIRSVAVLASFAINDWVRLLRSRDDRYEGKINFAVLAETA